MTGGEILIEALRQHGVKVIFGMPGGHLAHIYDALYKNQHAIRHILVRHEGGAAMMADGYARATGEVGVCLTIPGPGVSNAATGIAAAFTECVPVLLLSGQVETYFAGRDRSKMFHGLDQQAFLSPITQWQGGVGRVEEIPRLVAEAFSRLRTGRPRPVHLEIPADVLAAEASLTPGDWPLGKAVPPLPLPDADVDRAAELLARARRPVVLAGGGILHAEASDELAEVSRWLQAPVMTTLLGKGALSEEEPLSLSDLSGRAARAALREADVLLAVGTRFPQIDLDMWKLELPTPLIHLEADGSAIGADYPTEVGLAGDVKLGLRQLLEALRDRPHEDGWGSRRAELRAEAARQMRSHPYLTVLREELARDAILVNDVNHFAYHSRSAFPIYQPRTYFYPGVYVAMGYGLTGAIGAKAAFPGRQVVALCGDGGLMMTVQELATAIQFDLSVLVVVANDHCLTSIKNGQEREFGHSWGVDLHNPDFVQLAESFGARGWRVENPEEFRLAVREALRSEVVGLVEVALG